MSKTCILAGSGSRNLAEGIAELNNLDLLENHVVHFANAEMKVTLPSGIENYDKCIIVQTASNPANDNLMELFFTAETLKREGIETVEAIIPYFGYSRQDKQHLPFECVSVEIIAKLLANIGVEIVYTADIHNDKVLKNLPLKTKNLSAMQTMAKQVYKDLGIDEETESDFTVASPDQGGIKRAELFADNFYRNPENKEVVSIKKERELDKQHLSRAIELKGEINDKNVILVDDVSTSGGTILNAIELCKASNSVKNVYAVVVHADFAPGVPEKFRNSEIEKLYTTNSIEKTVENLSYYKKIKILDISSVFTGLK